jgi:hypothetical protein
LHDFGEWPRRCNFGGNSLIKEVGILDVKGDHFAVLYLQDGILTEKSSARTEFGVILEHDEITASFVVSDSDSIDELTGDLEFFFGIGFDGEDLGDFLDSRKTLYRDSFLYGRTLDDVEPAKDKEEER